MRLPLRGGPLALFWIASNCWKSGKYQNGSDATGICCTDPILIPHLSRGLGGKYRSSTVSASQVNSTCSPGSRLGCCSWGVGRFPRKHEYCLLPSAACYELFTICCVCGQRSRRGALCHRGNRSCCAIALKAFYQKVEVDKGGPKCCQLYQHVLVRTDLPRSSDLSAQCKLSRVLGLAPSTMCPQ